MLLLPHQLNLFLQQHLRLTISFRLGVLGYATLT